MPAWDQVITGTFGGAFGKHRCFYVDKALVVKILPNTFVDFVPLDDKILHGRPAQIKITVLKPQIL